MELIFDYVRLADMIRCLLCTPRTFRISTDILEELTLKLGEIDSVELQTEILEWLVIPQRTRYRKAKRALQEVSK